MATQNSEVNFSISNIKASGYSKFIVAYEVAANVYNAGETADLSAIKVVLNDKEVVAASKVVSAANKEANISILCKWKWRLQVLMLLR